MRIAEIVQRDWRDASAFDEIFECCSEFHGVTGVPSGRAKHEITFLVRLSEE